MFYKLLSELKNLNKEIYFVYKFFICLVYFIYF